MTPGRLEIHRFSVMSDRGPVPVLQLTGEVDAVNAAELRDALRTARAPAPMILDLSAVRFFDSAGFAVLDERLAEEGLFIVIAPDSLIREAATVVGLPFDDSLDDAAAAVARSAQPQTDSAG